MTQYQLRNQAGCHGNQYIVCAHLHPLVSSWRRVQAMAAPVIHHVLAVAVFLRNASTAMKLRAARAVLPVIALMLPVKVACILLVVLRARATRIGWRLSSAPTLVAGALWLGVRRPAIPVGAVIALRKLQ